MEISKQNTGKVFRNYSTGEQEIMAAIRANYRKMRSRQTLGYVQRMHKKYLTFDRPMHIWDAIEKLNEFVDLSDPDINLPNALHLFQTAEAIRKDGRPDWMQLVGLIHDLGKILFVKGCDQDGTSIKEQWGLVGDIFLVGCALPDSCVYPEYNKENPDMQNPAYNSELGIYRENCGIDNCWKAWGHDEYFYHVLRQHKACQIPEPGMIMIRYHSFYPWHTEGSYRHLMNEKDEQYLEWVRDFNKYDLYTKSQDTFDI
ncbi:MAG: inositol oxygenase family protein, partial [Chitinophagales bacterium]